METNNFVDLAYTVQSLTQRLEKTRPGPLPDRPIAIALVITDLDVGGAERAMVALATRLDRSVWNPSIICLGSEGALATVLREADLNVVCLDCRRSRPIQGVIRLARALRVVRPLLVQSFLFHANFATKLAAPFAWRPWVIGGIRVSERGRAWPNILDWMTQHLSAGSVCVSEGVRHFSEKFGKIRADRLMVIHNGVDTVVIDRAEPVARELLGFGATDRVALFVGRLTKQKGVSILLDAFSRIAADWKLTIVGDGEDRSLLERRTREDPRLADRVVFLGRRDDVPGLMKAANLLVLPSLWEGMPNVVLEAMAAGLAVCVSDVEGTIELVDERNGWISCPGDVNDLEVKLREATEDDAVRGEKGRAGRERVAWEFTHEVVVAAYERLWLGVIG